MKRTNDQSSGQSEQSKKPRVSQSGQGNYGMDAYAQYSQMAQYGSAAGQNNTGYNGYDQSSAAAAAAMYGMGYSNPQFLAAQYSNAAYNPAAAHATLFGAAATTSETETRTIYLGNVQPEITAQEILAEVHVGAVESYHHLPAKNCAFITFADPAAAQLFYQQHAPPVGKPLTVNSVTIKVGWGKSTKTNMAVQTAIRAGATRNVYLGRLDASDTEDTIRNTCSQFGDIEQVKVLPEKSIAFVHFLSIQSAMKCVSGLPSVPGWKNKKINYGKDHCADTSGKYLAAAAAVGYGMPTASYGMNFDPYGMNTAAAYGLPPSAGLGAMQQRTLYLGGLEADVTVEDICNQLRGGNIVQVRYLPEKHIAFVTYADASTAYLIWDYYNAVGLTIKSGKVRVNFGRPSTIPGQVSRAIQAGATRNVYIGGINDFSKFTQEKLRKDFAQYGDLELINTMPEKNCAFVNFTSIQSATVAITSIKGNPDYASLKVNYGKDRCGYPWKSTGASGAAYYNKIQDGKENQHSSDIN